MIKLKRVNHCMYLANLVEERLNTCDSLCGVNPPSEDFGWPFRPQVSDLRRRSTVHWCVRVECIDYTLPPHIRSRVL